VAFYSKDRYFTTRKMREVLGFHTSHRTEEGIVELAKWYREAGWVSVRGKG
jgi:nucleoside-diphosphate-sugar epimerase